MPIRKVGSDTPMSEIVMIALAANPSRRIAVKMPKTIPKISAKAPDTAASSSVAGSRSAMISATGRPCR
jgi:hypothetical protein